MITKIILEEKISAVFKLINSAENIVITAHKGPDGDAVGSSLGLYHFLYSLEKKRTVCHIRKIIRQSFLRRL